ncbi:MAG: energy transducer TonB family protein [Gemmatimonadota bacterium]
MKRRIARAIARPPALAALLALPMAAGCLSDEPIRRPEPLASGSPFRYPVELWDEGAEGETVLMVHITALGEVDSAYVFRSSGFPKFDSAAVDGAYDLRFTPGRRGEERIEMWARLPVRFSRDDTVSVRPPEGGP